MLRLTYRLILHKNMLHQYGYTYHHHSHIPNVFFFPFVCMSDPVSVRAPSADRWRVRVQLVDVAFAVDGRSTTLCVHVCALVYVCMRFNCNMYIHIYSLKQSTVNFHICP